MKPFQPYIPEKKLIIEVTAKEAHLIKVVRTISFGDIIVKKMNNVLVRIEPKTSILLNEEDGIDLEKKVE